MEDERLKREKRNRKTRQKRHESQAFRQGINGSLRRKRNEVEDEDIRSYNPQTNEDDE